jgi:hypothetical protein
MARVTRGSRYLKQGKKKHYIVHKPRSSKKRGAGDERRGRRRHPNRGRSGLHTVCGGGQTAQDVVRVSNMDGERDLSAPRGQQLAHMRPFRCGCLLG